MSEPKEYPVYMDDDGKLGLPLGLTKPNCIVVKKSAYDSLKQKLDEAMTENNNLKFELAVKEVLNLHADTFDALARSEDLEKYEAELAEQVRANKMLLAQLEHAEKGREFAHKEAERRLEEWSKCQAKLDEAMTLLDKIDKTSTIDLEDDDYYKAQELLTKWRNVQK